MEKEMFEINIDENGYYAEGNDGTLVAVESIPEVDDICKLSSYKYDKKSQSLVVDKDKMATILAEIQDEIDNAVTNPTESERLDAIEDAIAELASIIGGE